MELSNTGLEGVTRGNNTGLPSLCVLPSLTNNPENCPFTGKKPCFNKNHSDGSDANSLLLPLMNTPTRIERTFKDTCIIKKWVDEGLILDRYKCYLIGDTCFCDTTIGCYWRQ